MTEPKETAADLVALIAREKAKQEPDAKVIADAEKRLATVDAKTLKDSELDVDALYEKWTTASSDGGWGEEVEGALYDRLELELQGALRRELDRRVAQA